MLEGAEIDKIDGIDTQTADAVARVVAQAIDLGLADADYSALFAAVAGSG